jgi:hypothetical protein
MKRTFKLFGILVLAGVIGFILAACGNGGGDDNGDDGTNGFTDNGGGDDNGDDGTGGFTGNERVQNVEMNSDGIASQHFATIFIERAVSGLLKQSQIMEAQYNTLSGSTATSIRGIEKNIVKMFQRTGSLSSGREQISTYVNQIINLIAPQTQDPELFRKKVEAQHLWMELYNSGCSFEEHAGKVEEYKALREEINAMDSTAQIPVGAPEEFFVPQIAGMIPADCAKYPQDLAQHIADLYEFESFTYDIKNNRGFNINLP